MEHHKNPSKHCWWKSDVLARGKWTFELFTPDFIMPVHMVETPQKNRLYLHFYKTKEPSFASLLQPLKFHLMSSLSKMSNTEEQNWLLNIKIFCSKQQNTKVICKKASVDLRAGLVQKCDHLIFHRNPHNHTVTAIQEKSNGSFLTIQKYFLLYLLCPYHEAYLHNVTCNKRYSS